MKKLSLVCAFCICVFSSFTPKGYILPDDKKLPSMLAGSESTAVQGWVDSLYGKLHLDSLGLERKVFFYACKGYEYLLSTGQLAKSETLTSCDDCQSGKARPLYII